MTVRLPAVALAAAIASLALYFSSVWFVSRRAARSASYYALNKDKSVDCRNCAEAGHFEAYRGPGAGARITEKWDGEWLAVQRRGVLGRLILSPDRRTLVEEESLEDVLTSPPKNGGDSSRFLERLVWRSAASGTLSVEMLKTRFMDRPLLNNLRAMAVVERPSDFGLSNLRISVREMGGSGPAYDLSFLSSHGLDRVTPRSSMWSADGRWFCCDFEADPVFARHIKPLTLFVDFVNKKAYFDGTLRRVVTLGPQCVLKRGRRTRHWNLEQAMAKKGVKLGAPLELDLTD